MGERHDIHGNSLQPDEDMDKMKPLKPVGGLSFYLSFSRNCCVHLRFNDLRLGALSMSILDSNSTHVSVVLFDYRHAKLNFSGGPVHLMVGKRIVSIPEVKKKN
jgi:hypothetical protein